MAMPEFPPSELEAGQISLPELGKMFKMPTEEKTGFLKKMLLCRSPCNCNYFCRTADLWRKIKRSLNSLYPSSSSLFIFNSSYEKTGSTQNPPGISASANFSPGKPFNANFFEG